MLKTKALYLTLIGILIASFCFAEDITITTYYPSPFGSYNELATNKLAVDVAGVAVSSEYAAMQNGDVHIGRSLIVGAGGGSGFAYDERIGPPDTRPGNGDVLISGEVGIGTTIPQRKLHVNGPDNGSSTAQMLITSSDAPTEGLNIGWRYDGATIYGRMQGWQGGARNIVLNDDGGNVGIGTNNPNYKLHIDNGAGDSWLQFTDTSSGTASTDGFLVGANDSGAYLIQRENRFLTFRTNNTDRMTIDSAGRVGIGITDPTPNSKLHIQNGRIYATDF